MEGLKDIGYGGDGCTAWTSGVLAFDVDPMEWGGDVDKFQTGGEWDFDLNFSFDGDCGLDGIDETIGVSVPDVVAACDVVDYQEAMES